MAKRYLDDINFACICFFILILYPFQLTGGETRGKLVRPSAIAGSFYPGSPIQLKSDINSFFEEIPALKPAGQIIAALAPHAQILSYANSGDIPAGDKHRVVGYCSVLMVIHHSSR